MMCQASVYLDGKKIMEDVLLVEPVAGGVQLVKMFEPVRFVPGTLRRIDLMKHQIIVESPHIEEVEDE